MRKRLNLSTGSRPNGKKKQSCALCKPHKMHGDNRWKPRELISLKEFEKEKRKF